MEPSAISSAVSSDSLEIPLIDFSAFVSGDATTRRTTARALLEGFQSAGFIYLRNHGVPRADVQATFAESQKFFKRPQAQKELMCWTTPEANRGYSQPGREKTTDLTDAADIEAKRAEEGADLKESMEIGREGEPDHPNQWPDQFDEDGKVFKKQMLAFHDTCKELHVKVMSAIAVGLGIDEHYFDSFCDGGDNTLRLLHYPEVRHEVFVKNENQVRAGAHTDYGSITLLFQDMAGGLQVLSPNKNFIDATPIEDAIVVNAADLLARWSNDRLKSTKHRVVEPPTKADVHPARYSIAYFCNPNFDRFIEAIPGTYSAESPKKYEVASISPSDSRQHTRENVRFHMTCIRASLHPTDVALDELVHGNQISLFSSTAQHPLEGIPGESRVFPARICGSSGEDRSASEMADETTPSNSTSALRIIGDRAPDSNDEWIATRVAARVAFITFDEIPKPIMNIGTRV